jgi:hypothetical protein
MSNLTPVRAKYGIEFQGDSVIIQSNHILKRTKPGKHLQNIVLQIYEAIPPICIVKILEEYVRRTKPLRHNETKLLIST